VDVSILYDADRKNYNSFKDSLDKIEHIKKLAICASDGYNFLEYAFKENI